VLPAVAQTTKGGTYHVAETYKLEVSGGYDYMTFDPATHLLYIAQGDQVLVFDAAKGAVAGTLKGLVHTHGVVLDKDGVTGYVSDGGSGIVQIFSRSPLAKTGTITVGSNPDGMVIEPTTGHLFVFNGKSKNLSVVDLGAKKVIATVALPGKPEFPTADGKGNVFVNIEDTHQVMKISAGDSKPVATWTIAGCESPSGMAIDADAGRIFPVCDNGKMPVIDTTTGKVVAMPSIGAGPDAAAYDAVRHMVFSSNGDAGTLSIVHQVSPDSYTTVQTVKTVPKGRTLALDKATGAIYIIAPDPASTAAVKPLVLLKVTP
jgi:DNA-binding beta-propeller fold protein YncE